MLVETSHTAIAVTSMLPQVEYGAQESKGQRSSTRGGVGRADKIRPRFEVAHLVRVEI